MKPALAQVCSLPTPLATDFEEYAAGKCAAIELWWGKLEAFLASSTPDDLQALRSAHGIETPVVSFQGGILHSQGERRKEAWDLFHNRLALAAQLDIGLLVVAADVPSPPDAATIERFHVSLGQAAEAAAEHGRELALEFQAGSSFCNNLQTAVAVVEQVGHPALGICLDAFHFSVGPSKGEDLALLDTQNLKHVQLCDMMGVCREFATDSERILPGDGDLFLAPLIDRLREIDYQRFVSVELMNPQLYQVPPRSFGEIAMTAIRKLLGLTEDAA